MAESGTECHCMAKQGEWVARAKIPEFLDGFWGDFIDKIWGESCRVGDFLLIGW